MHKGTSENMQARDRSGALNGTKNFTRQDFLKGADDLLAEKAGLVSEKKEIELWMQKYRQDKARRRFDSSFMMKWEVDRRSRSKRMLEIDQRLTEIKRVFQYEAHAQRDKLSYVEAFYRVAKDTLPAEILARMNSATIALLAHYNDRLDDA